MAPRPRERRRRKRDRSSAARAEATPARRGAGWGDPRVGGGLLVSLVLSALVHGIVYGVMPTTWASREAPALFVDVTIDGSGSERGMAGVDRIPGHQRASSEVVRPGGSSASANVDARRRGGGGERSGGRDVIRLVTASAEITLVDAPLDAPDRSQIQRIATDRTRASWDARRATPNPNDDPFLASGDGAHRERRAPSAVDAREGALRAPLASREGTLAGAGPGAPASRTRFVAPSPVHEPARGDGALGATRGAAHASPGVGIVSGRGLAETPRAAVASGRPPVDRGPAATLADDEGRVRDDTDSELLAASLVEARVDASRRAGLEPLGGRGGEPGGSEEGSGGARGPGGLASPWGPGGGAHPALDTSDARYLRWLLTQRRRIERRLVFPRERQLARDQGTSVVRLTVRRDGSLARPPRVIRTSGYADLDRAALVAVRASLPFEPIPSDLGIGHPEIVVTLPIEFSNPMVD